jgi:serine phosphatase RsbU (regulator of sigma subunit)
VAQGLKILLADADAAARARNAAELRELGLEVSEAADGQSVLDAYAQARPDLVIVDLDLPDISGFALTRILRQRALPDWQPVIVLGAAADEEAVLQAYEAGADAFIRKTVSPRLLHARLRPIVRSLMMQRESLARERELQRRSEAEEAEKRLAQHLMTRLINADKLNDPALECWVSPAQTLSGDLVAAARTPGGVLHVLLADGTGHGLAASLNVLPITAPFYRMTERGFGIGAIARELNAKLREMMPVDRFVAATLAAIDFREQVVQVWNGGNPMAWLLGPNGHAECMFASNRVPLGLIEDEDFDETVESCVLQAGSQLVLYSDGLIEAEDAAGEVFGEERLALLLGEAPLQERLGRVKEGLSSHLSGCGAHDDVSLVLVKFDAADTQPRARAVAPVRPAQAASAWRLGLRLGPAELRTMDVVPMLLGTLNHFESLRPHAGALFIILSEFYNNALDHGVLQLSSALKREADGMDRYFELRGRRLAELAAGSIEIEIEHRQDDAGERLAILCRDSGTGFDYKAAGDDDGTGARSPCGRGLTLVRSLCEELAHSGSGNEARAIYRLDAPSA